MEKSKSVELSNLVWKKSLIGELLKPKSTNSGIDKNKLILKGGRIPYITRTDINNGYGDFVCEQNSKHAVDNANVITIGLDTQTVFYQSYQFYTGQNIQILNTPFINKYTALFIIPLLKIQMQKFNWGGNGATLGRLNKTNLLLPSQADDTPDYVYMEAYSKKLYQQKQNEYFVYIQNRVAQLSNTAKPISLEEKEWDSFFIHQIAEILSGRDIYEKERIDGKIPYVSATANNNGIGYYIGNKNNTLEKDCLSVNRNGSVGYSFYHPYNALFSNDCRKLRLKCSTKYIGLFISNQITLQKEKYGYGYKMGTGRLMKQKIMLPVANDGSLDYEYMEQFMKYHEYQKLKDYLDFKKGGR